MVFVSLSKAQRKIAENIRNRRLYLTFTQEELATRSGVPISTLRKFEQKGVISLEAFLKLLLIVGGLEDVIKVLEPPKTNFKSIDDVLKSEEKIMRKRGHSK